ncbi:uncharacterized protein LOC117168055 isoform X2 [Belonocnema kinseyi]|nr:uncharacterized protein LOC117168055 isoform X2 [Belonocnema kinseyi]
MNRKRVNPELLDAIEKKLRCVQSEFEVIKQKSFSQKSLSPELSENDELSGSDHEINIDPLVENEILLRDPLLDFTELEQSPNQESEKGEVTEPPEKVDDLDPSIRNIIGDDPAVPKSLDLVLHPILVSRLKFWTEQGMAKKDSEGLLSKYKKLKFLEAPKLNPPVEAKLSLSAKRRDEYRKQAQDAVGSAIMIVGSVASTLITEKESVEPSELFEKLYHALQILADTYNKQSISRRDTTTKKVLTRKSNRLRRTNRNRADPPIRRQNNRA